MDATELLEGLGMGSRLGGEGDWTGRLCHRLPVRNGRRSGDQDGFCVEAMRYEMLLGLSGVDLLALSIVPLLL